MYGTQQTGCFSTDSSQGGVVSKLWTYNSFTSLVLPIDIATWKTAKTEKREVSLPTALNELG